MEYDYEYINLIGNKQQQQQSSTSPTASSSCSTSSTTSSSSASNPPMQQPTKSINSQFATMSSSTSQIFATAASFNICQNDTVYYTRETVHMLAKFLSEHSTSPIFRSLYSFAPDNLAWLWSFFDWQTPLIVDAVPTQHQYAPFTAADNLTIGETELYEVNKLFLDAPLVQYKYREPIMIGDVYKFLEHVSKIEQSMVARALFLIYFPRFSGFIENPLKELIRIKILKSNVNVVRRVDETIIALITSRYPNIDDYKEKIQRGTMLPSYIRTLLKENNLLPAATNQNTTVETALTQQKKQMKAYLQLKHSNLEKVNSGLPLYSPFSVETVPNNDQDSEKLSSTVFFPVTKTIDYMKLYEEQDKQINSDLDHVSFDKKKAIKMQESDVFYDNNASHIIDENNNDCDDNLDCLADYQDTEYAAKYFELISNKQKTIEHLPISELNLATLALPKLNPTETYSNTSSSTLTSPRHEANLVNMIKEKELHNQLNAARLLNSARQQNYLNMSGCISPPSPKYNSKSLIHTPKTPSNLNQYAEKQTDYSVWSNGTPNPAKLNLPNSFYNSMSVVTPPPSAGFRTNTPLSIITGSTVAPIGSRLNSPVGSNCAELLSPSSMFNKHQLNRLNESLNLGNKSGIVQDDLNEYLKHQFYGSPVTRATKLSEYQSKKFVKKSEMMFEGANNYQANYCTNLETTRYNSNTNLSSNGTNVFFQADLNSPKSPSSTTSATHHAPQQQFHNPNHRVHTSHNHQQHTWVGRLPPKIFHDNSIYSRKVFLGGLPWDVNQAYLVQLLQKYGSVKLEIPGKDQKHPRVSNLSKGQERSTPGYVYIIFEHESSVQRMLTDCRKETKNGGEHYFYTIFIPPTANNNQNNNQSYYQFNSNLNKRGKAKEVEVIPWNQEDTSYVPQNKTSMLPAKIDSKTTIFVGALHGMLNAHGLAKVMNEVFGEVIHAGLDTDKYKYPIGSGRVTFRNRASYVKAIKSKFVTIRANQESNDPSPKFEKTIQIDPYLEDAKCCKCGTNRSYFFCRNEFCLDYYCEGCWKTNHNMINNGEHQSLSRQNKPEQSHKSFK